MYVCNVALDKKSTGSRSSVCKIGYLFLVQGLERRISEPGVRWAMSNEEAAGKAFRLWCEFFVA